MFVGRNLASCFVNLHTAGSQSPAPYMGFAVGLLAVALLAVAVGLHPPNRLCENM